MIDVYYPYFHREAIWEELRYSVRSVCMHLKEEFRLVIVGDRPAWLNDHPGAVFIPHARSEGMGENATFDALAKLILYLETKSPGDHFIRMYDDTLLLADVKAEDLKVPRAMYSADKVPRRSGVWWDQLRRTLYHVQKDHRDRNITSAVYNYETHFPECFQAGKLKEVISGFEAVRHRLLTSTLYWNTFFPYHHPVLFRKDWGIQLYNNADNLFYSSSEGNLEEKCRGRLFLNYNNAGLNDNLRRFLSERFPGKSPFER